MALHPEYSGSFLPPLSPKEEEEVIKRYESGDPQAKNVLIEHNLRLVAHIAKKYSGQKADRDDLVSIGTIGLIKAVSSFNSAKGIKLSTYAARCIENEILMYFRGAKKCAQDISLNEALECDDSGITLMDVISDQEDIVDKIDTGIKIEKLRSLLKSELTPRERTIINYRYGLDGHKELPQREVAARLNISRSYVSRIEKKALIKLFAKLNK
ncbi:MAG: RNA polymerase sporulation sigma factor SigK [Oscillospiraceae bacterium]|nr:RNA polymerase sporulation sigma factor SigK [Candidatus Equicaccousia limihippi]